METKNKSAKTNRNLDELLSKLNADEILGFSEMSKVRGGDGDGTGSDPVIVPPPPTGN